MDRQGIVVDRIENEFAVCEINSVFTNIPLSQIDGSVHEGDMLCADENGTQYTVDSIETEKLRKYISKRFEDIKKKNRKK